MVAGVLIAISDRSYAGDLSAARQASFGYDPIQILLQSKQSGKAAAVDVIPTRGASIPPKSKA